MPRKRPVEMRIAETQAKMDDLMLEKTIKDMKVKRMARGSRRRRRSNGLSLMKMP